MPGGSLSETCARAASSSGGMRLARVSAASALSVCNERSTASPAARARWRRGLSRSALGGSVPPAHPFRSGYHEPASTIPRAAGAGSFTAADCCSEGGKDGSSDAAAAAPAIATPAATRQPIDRPGMKAPDAASATRPPSAALRALQGPSVHTEIAGEILSTLVGVAFQALHSREV